VIILGGKKDQEAAKALAGASYGLNACGSFSVEESAAVLSLCRLVICSDSGPMHLAGALGKPTVVVFSRINALMHRWFPLGNNHTILHREVECSGCGLMKCPIANHPCMGGVTVHDILSVAVRKLHDLFISDTSLGDTQVLNW